MRKPNLITQFEQRSHRNRFRFLTELLRPLKRPIRILDVGGEFNFWNILDYKRIGKIEVILLNRFPQDMLPTSFHSHVGDARSLANYTSDDIDVIISNSVIGHVGSFGDQMAMATEIRRLGKRYFVQTPNHYFPIDWRTLLPFFHFLPLKVRARLLNCMPLASFGRCKSYSSALQWASGVRNLTHRELELLFPDATIVRDKFTGLTKSYIVYHGFDAPIIAAKLT